MKTELLTTLALRFGTAPFTSGPAATYLDRHVQAVGSALGRVARSGATFAGPEGPVRLRRLREVQGGRSLWRFEPAPAGSDEDLL